MASIPLSMTIGGTVITVPDLRRSPDVRVALAMFLHAVADEIDPKEVLSDGPNQAEPLRR